MNLIFYLRRKLTSRGLIFVENSNAYLVPRTFNKTAGFKASSKRMVAAQWYTIFTEFCRMMLSSWDIPKFANITSPAITLTFCMMSRPRVLFNKSNNWKCKQKWKLKFYKWKFLKKHDPKHSLNSSLTTGLL